MDIVLVGNALGHVELIADGEIVPLGGRLARRMVAALILHRNRTLPDEALVDSVWGDMPPANAAASVQAYVSRLRSTLGPNRGALARTSGGYRLDLDDVDLVRFEALVADAVRLLPEDPALALEVSIEGERLWRGVPFTELEDSSQARGERARLEELHELLSDTRIDALIRDGRANEALAYARAALERTPYREHRWSLLILALYRSGRQADAMHELRAVKRLLADELGIDPGAELQELELRVFAADPQLLSEPLSQNKPESASSLPQLYSSFHGREDLWASLVWALDAHRLVSLVGPGGVGKTRVALEWLRRLPTDERTWYVSLTDVSDEASVAAVVSRALGVVARGPDLGDRLAALLSDRPGLLVIDNCEHVLSGVRAFLPLVLGRTQLRILLTSREAMGMEGEGIIDVAPLPSLAADGSDGPAMHLLLARVGSARAGWLPTDNERRAARELCDALDGLPLAIELAAVRARTMSLESIAHGVGRSTSVLGTTPAGSVAAHANLRETVDWSYRLLQPAAQRTLTRLWPFEGGFDLDLAASVQEDAPEVEVLESLSSLVSKSFVTVYSVGGRARYRLWESVRTFVGEQQADRPALRAAHFRAMKAYVATTSTVMASRHSRHAMQSLVSELPNIRAMFRYGLEFEPRDALESYVRLEWFWFRAGQFSEAIMLAEGLLGAAADADPEIRARALISQAVLSHSVGDFPGAARILGSAAGELDRLDRESIHTGRVAYFRSVAALQSGRLDEASEASEVALAVAEALGDRVGEINALMQIGAIALAGGDIGGGRRTLEVAVSVAGVHGTPWTRGMASLHLARALAAETPTATASVTDPVRVAVRVFLDEADVGTLCQAADLVAIVLDREGRDDSAERLRSATASVRSALGMPSTTSLIAYPHVDVERAVAQLRSLAESWLTQDEPQPKR